MLLNDLNSFDIDITKKHVFLVSFGSVEQHGPYAPLGTDTYIQDSLLERVMNEVPEIVYLPTIPISVADSHVGFTGTVSLRSETLYSMMSDIVVSLAPYASVIIFVSWHGGNKSVIENFVDKEHSKYAGIHLVQFTFGDEGTDTSAEALVGGSLDDHAGNTEVSLMLATKPRVTQIPEYGSKKEPIHFEWDRRIITVTDKGIIDSNPVWVASSELGEKLAAIYAENLINKLRQTLKSEY